jgi:hypothetical protein
VDGDVRLDVEYLLTMCGVGGAANTYKPTEDELRHAKAHNEKVRSDSFTKDRGGLKGLKDKAKEVISGKDSSEK